MSESIGYENPSLILLNPIYCYWIDVTTDLDIFYILFRMGGRICGGIVSRCSIRC